MTLHAALLRGINLGKRQVVMKDLRAVCEGGGFRAVRTLLASGNLVLDAKEKGAALEKKLEGVTFDGLGLKTDVFARTGPEIEAVIAANPFKAFAQTNPTFLVIAFMRGPASAAELKGMEETALLGEEVRQGKGCLYIKFPKGQGPSKLKTPKLATSRNWNTVTKLAAMMAAE